MRWLAAVVALGLLVAGIIPAGAANGVAFPDGAWEGTAIWTGAISKKDIFASGSGTSAFTLGIDGGEVTGGEMTLQGTGQSQVPNATGKLSIVETLQLSGTAAVVKGFGQVGFKGTVNVQDFGTVPVSGSFAASGSFSPTFASCNKVTGDLAADTRKIQQSYGFNTSVTAKFVAIRTAGGSASAAIVDEYKSLTAELIALEDFTANELPALAHQIDALNAKILGLGPCQEPPEGFEHGLSDTLLTALFQDLLEAPAQLPENFPTHYLLSLLGVGIRVGAVGASVPGSAPLKQKAQELLAGFEAGLELKLNEAIATGDAQTIIDILIGAQQFGLDALADKAQGGLAQVQP
ncbi:MAG: hypothetical protein ACRDIZ_10320 [Actinomycetota bacterium]